MSDTSDRYATWDAAYVLGALAPGERREYEEHLAGCASCEAAVGELAGLPGLLAQLPADDALALVPAAAPAEVLDERPPADCLEPDRVRARPASLRRGRLVAAAAAGVAAGVLLVLVGIAYAVGLVPFESGDPRRLAFASVGPTGLTAVVDVLPVGDGTDINVECVDGQPGSGRTYTSYRIYVWTAPGRAGQGVAGQAQQDHAPQGPHRPAPPADRAGRDPRLGHRQPPAPRLPPLSLLWP